MELLWDAGFPPAAAPKGQKRVAQNEQNKQARKVAGTANRELLSLGAPGEPLAKTLRPPFRTSKFPHLQLNHTRWNVIYEQE